MRALAIQLRVWIHIGSLALASTEDEDKAVNRSFLINQEGRIQARYDKIHLFDAHPAPDEVYAESETYVRGRKAVVTPSPWGKIGLTVCYDLRFPGLYRSLAQAGAGLILVPSAFSATTGAKHWEPLLRARAIETGAYIAAAAQGGTHADGRQTWGHSMIVDPDGAILDQAQHDSPAVVTASLDVQKVRDARSRIPAWSVDPHFDAA
jgi:predicted amidohydrolase